MENFEKYLEVARQIAHEAGSFLMENYGKFQEISNTEGTHYSVVEDKKCNNLYEEFLSAKTPEVSLYTEEGERSLESDLVWVVDPIDGTSNYRVGIPLFVTQICLLYKKEPVASVLYNPALGQEFTAIKDGGAFMNGELLTVNEIAELKRSVLVQAKGSSIIEAARYLTLMGSHVRTARIFGGCTGIDLILIASGRGEVTINSGSKIFDYAPGVLLVREAGGVVRNIKGGEWTIDDDNLVASNKKLMSQVLDILSGQS